MTEGARDSAIVGGPRQPVVSIGMPIYNDERFASEAISSLLAQTFTDFELIISDNASTDGTPSLCARYAERDPRVRYVRQSRNIGLTGNLNFVRDEARGEFFMWAASDDRWQPTFIEYMVRALRNDPSSVLAFSAYTFMDEEGQRIGPERRTNYRSRFRFWRLVKLCWFYDDGCFYGLHRREVVASATIPRWRGMNAATPFNNAYPPLFYLLARGNFALVDSAPLWINRLRRRSSHLSTIPTNAARKYFALVGRKTNVLEVSAAYVYRATQSWPIVIGLLPALAARCAYDCLERIVAFAARRVLGINIGLEAKLVEGWRQVSG
jgi:glycosyltransferase involved in cell wall biosynthesis